VNYHLQHLHLTLRDIYHKGQPKGHKNETKVIANMAVATLKKASTLDEQKCSSIVYNLQQSSDQ